MNGDPVVGMCRACGSDLFAGRDHLCAPASAATTVRCSKCGGIGAWNEMGWLGPCLRICGSCKGIGATPAPARAPGDDR